MINKCEIIASNAPGATAIFKVIYKFLEVRYVNLLKHERIPNKTKALPSKISSKMDTRII